MSRAGETWASEANSEGGGAPASEAPEVAGGTLAPPAEPAVSGDPPPSRYTLGEPLGAGGVGEVRAAHDAVLRREVAIKRLIRDLPGTRDRFVAEAQVTAQLDHPNIVPVHDLGVDADGRLYLAMKRVRGRSLAELLESPDAPVLEGRLDIFRKVCDAVAFAHARGVLHRDLKPDNIMVGAFGEVLVMDWGLARAVGARDAPVQVDRFEGDALRTRDGQVAGTPAFMAPEQAEGRLDALDARTDVYGLGAVLYTLLTGRAPFSGEPLVVLEAVKRGRFSPPGRVARVPRELDAVVRKAMALRPDDRYASVDALREDIEAWLQRRPLRHVRSTWTERLGKWVSRHRSAVGAASLVGAGALVALGLGVWRYVADVGEARDRAVAEAERAVEADKDARRQLVATRVALADSLAEQGTITVAGAALREADTLARTLDGDRRALDLALSAHALASPPPVATCNMHGGEGVRALAVAPGGDRVVSLGADGRLVTWAVAGCEELDVVLLGPPTRAALGFDARGVRGLVGVGGTVRPFHEGRELAALPAFEGVYRVQLEGDDALVALHSGETWRVSLPTGAVTAAGTARPDRAVWWPVRA